MTYYINVRFGQGTKNYYFSTEDGTLLVGDFVVVETVVGLELAEVTTEPQPIETLNFDREIKPILRKALEEDLKTYEFNKELAQRASDHFLKHIDELKLDMRLLDSQYTLDRAKILFTYVADDRVDFRELLKLLASDLHCRIELKQVNSRERAQIVGGLGVCGLPLCCTTFLTQFDGVSLNKAKNQMLSINIPKLSGQCDRLMCCLKYEDDYYTEAKKQFPSINTKIHYQDAEYKITSFNIFTKIIKLQNGSDVAFLSLDEVNSLLNKTGFRKPLSLDKEAFQKSKDNKQKEQDKKQSSEELAHKPKVGLKPNLNNKPTPQEGQNQDSKQRNKSKEHAQIKDVQPAKNDKKQDFNNHPKHNKHQNEHKKPAKREENAVSNQNSNTSNNKPLFAGQANKVKEYQETYAKNNPSKKPQNSKHQNSKPRNSKVSNSKNVEKE